MVAGDPGIYLVCSAGAVKVLWCTERDHPAVCTCVSWREIGNVRGNVRSVGDRISAGVAMTPSTRDEALRLLEDAGWDTDRITIEEERAVRDVYAIDDPRPVSETVDPDSVPMEIPLPRGARWLVNRVIK
jgi:hypothetical protein